MLANPIFCFALATFCRRGTTFFGGGATLLVALLLCTFVSFVVVRGALVARVPVSIVVVVLPRNASERFLVMEPPDVARVGMGLFGALNFVARP